MLIGVCILILVHFGYMMGERQFGWPYLLGPFFGLLYGPLYLLYTQSLTSTRIAGVVLHFIPAFITLFLVLFLGDVLLNYLPVVSILITLHFTAYLVYALRGIYGYRKKLKDEASSFHHISLKWLEAMIYIQLTILLVAVVEGFLNTSGLGDVLVLVIYAMVLILLNCFYYLGLKQVSLFSGIAARKAQTTKREYAIPETTFAEYKKTIEAYFDAEQPYLEYDLSLNDLSEQLSISTRNLSHVINKGYGKNFYDFVNDFRLRSAKGRLLSTSDPVKEIMYDSGFSNKATFNAIFKKDTGLTPTQFRQRK